MAYTTIDDPTAYFQTALWSGDGSTNNAITNDGNSNLQPDFVWIKKRTNADDHILANSVSGATKYLISNSTTTEQTYSGSVKSFDSNGFTVGDGNQINQSSNTFVGWQWKAGGTASSNTDGSITSSVSANTTAGFSIVSYTGTGANATVGHGLGAEAKCIIFKDRDTASDWRMYHVGVGNTGALTLNNTNATQTNSVFFQNTTPTSTVFSLGTGTDVNNTNAFIAYCFAEKKGYSKFGSYTGNGNADGTFIYTGFKPAWVMVKKSSGTNAWLIVDNKRDTFNPTDGQLFASTNGAEDTTSTNNNFDYLSNGFKARNTGDAYNGSSGTYIYMAFAENPFVTSGGIPCTAR